MIKNTRTLALLGALTAVVLTDHAQAASAMLPAGSTLTVTPSLVSNYMFRGQRLGGLSFQPTVEFASGAWTAGVWINQPVEVEVPGVSDPEIDPYVTYTRTINDSLSLTVGTTVYWYPKADKSAGFYRQTVEPSIALNYTASGFKLTPKLYYDLKMEQVTAEITVQYAMPLEAWGTELVLSGTYGDYLADEVANSTPSVKAWGNYYSIGVSAPYQLSETSKLTLGAAYAGGSDSFVKSGTSPKFANPLEDSRWVFSLSYGFSL